MCVCVCVGKYDVSLTNHPKDVVSTVNMFLWLSRSFVFEKGDLSMEPPSTPAAIPFCSPDAQEQTHNG